MVFISCLPLYFKAEVLTTLLEVSEDGLATGAGPVLGVMYDSTSMNVRSRSHSPRHKAESTPWYDNNSSSSNVRGVSHPVRQVRPWSYHSSFRVVQPIPPNNDKKLSRMDNLRDDLYRLSPLYNVCIPVQCTRYVDLPRLYSVQEQYKSCTCTYEVAGRTVSIELERPTADSLKVHVIRIEDVIRSRGCNIPHNHILDPPLALGRTTSIWPVIPMNERF